MTQKIQVVPYNPLWASQYEEEATKIKQALGENCLGVYHVGSTSVPGLAAKSKIDIIAVVKDMAAIFEPLDQIGYISKGEFNIPFRESFTRRGSLKVNLHIFEEGNPEIELNLLFRDYLRTHPEAREEYTALKLNLIKKDTSHARRSGRFRGYNLGKDVFIKGILEKTGFKGLCIRICTHYDEWEAARHFRQKYFFDNVPVEDPYTWTFDHPDHLHLILYQGPRIIGYAHIQKWPDQRAALRIIVIEEPFRGHGYGSTFLNLCEKWLKQKGFKILQTQSSPKAYPFYIHQGYTKMPFDDPEDHESHPDDIDMGKTLD